MQWPPTPGPGRNGMNPKGFVAAASTTSHTSRPIRSHSIASWLIRAMLTLRKMFSSSLAISAASGEDSSITVRLTCRNNCATLDVADFVSPPTSLGMSRPELAGSPGLTRSGTNARSKSRPATRPLPASSVLRSGPEVVPGYVVDCRTMSWPRRSPLATNRAASRTWVRSGSRDSSIGVGTQMTTASAPVTAATSRPVTWKPAFRAAASRSSLMSSMGEEPAAICVTLASQASTPQTARPASVKLIASGKPTYPRPTIARRESTDRREESCAPVAASSFIAALYRARRAARDRRRHAAEWAPSRRAGPGPRPLSGVATSA